MDVSFTPPTDLFSQGEMAPSTQWVERLVGFKTVLDVVWKGKIPTLV
jgi:hypothetical protein